MKPPWAIPGRCASSWKSIEATRFAHPATRGWTRLGFGLENYDAIGAWRTQDGKFPIDSAGTLPNGKSFTKPSELKAILRADKEEFSKGLTEKMMTYALGRGLERFDRPAVQSVHRRLAAKGYRFSALVMGIVESLPFQMRRGEGPRS